MSQSHGSSDFLLFTVHSNFASPETNHLRHHAVLSALLKEGAVEGDTLHVVQLQNEGVKKVGYIVSESFVDLVEDYLEEFEGDSYLLLTTHMHGMRKATRMTLDHNKDGVFVGYMRSAPAGFAIRNDYVLRQDTDTYFIIHPSDETNMTELAKLGFYSYN